MSRLWPHTAYAEDQPYAHSILTVHVLTRAIQSGAIVGAGLSSTIFVLRNLNVLKPSIPPAAFTRTLLRSTGVGAVAATALLAVGLPLRMRGREDIEWRDRNWRLLENQGQLECDDWTYPAMTLGGVVAASKSSVLGWRGVAGGVGAGSVLGMVGYMGWRYGLKHGEREEGVV